MYTFSIKAMDAFGKQRVLEIKAKNQNLAFSVLRGQGFKVNEKDILNFQKDTFVSRVKIFLISQPLFSASKYDVNRLIKMIGNSLSRGKTLKTSLEFIGENEDNRRLKRLIDSLLEEMKKPFTSQIEVFKKFPHHFEDEFLGIVEAGESSSNLGQYMVDYVKQKEEQAKLNHQFKTVLTKRLITFLTVIAVAMVVVFFVIPQFKSLFGDSLDIPWAMQSLINISSVIKENGLSISFTLLALTSLLIYMVTKNKKIRWWWHDALLHFPILGRTLKTYYTAQFAYFLSTLLTKNVDIIKAMNIVIKQTKNVCLRATYKNLIQSMRSGDDLFKAIVNESRKGKSYLIPSIVQAAKVGSETATLGETLMDVRNDLDILLEVRLKRSIKLFSLIFYALIILMALFIAYAIGSAVIVFYDNAQNLM